MISLEKAIQIVKDKKLGTIINVYEGNKRYIFSYPGDMHRGFFSVNKQSGKFEMFFPQDDFQEYRTMKFIKKL